MDIIPNSQIAGYKDLETTFTKRNVYNSGLYAVITVIVFGLKVKIKYTN